MATVTTSHHGHGRHPKLSKRRAATKTPTIAPQPKRMRRSVRSGGSNAASSLLQLNRLLRPRDQFPNRKRFCNKTRPDVPCATKLGLANRRDCRRIRKIPRGQGGLPDPRRVSAEHVV